MFDYFREPLPLRSSHESSFIRMCWHLLESKSDTLYVTRSILLRVRLILLFSTAAGPIQDVRTKVSRFTAVTRIVRVF